MLIDQKLLEQAWWHLYHNEPTEDERLLELELPLWLEIKDELLKLLVERSHSRLH